jgi:hypothetical protein
MSDTVAIVAPDLDFCPSPNRGDLGLPLLLLLRRRPADESVNLLRNVSQLGARRALPV